MNIEIKTIVDSDQILHEILDEIGWKSILDELNISEDTILDEFYFSEILDAAILRDQAEVESDIANSSLEMVQTENVYYTNIIPDVKRYFKNALSHHTEPVLLALKNVAFEHGWELTFTKKI